jgi:class 3 adenylate cyclase
LSTEGLFETRHCAVLIVDIAGTVALRTEFGDAAAGRRIRNLLDAIADIARKRGGTFIQSSGDDVLVVFEQGAVGAAARTAVDAQRLAQRVGLQLYAGLHAGPVELGHSMGQPVTLGQTVNIAARLHKLIEDVPGQIFLTETSVQALPRELRGLAMRYGERMLKGVGAHHICTLEWREATEGPVERTLFSTTAMQAWPQRKLLLRHGGRELLLEPDDKSSIVGRAADCALPVPDPLTRISSKHLLLQSAAGHWLAQDISRNGTWIMERGNPAEAQLPYCHKATLPAAGALCLGRPFADDPERRCVLEFEVLAE